VAYYIDGVNVFETEEAPYTFTYEPGRHGDGDHSLTVRATIGDLQLESSPIGFSSTAPASEGSGGLPIVPIAVGVTVLGLAIVGLVSLVGPRMRRSHEMRKLTADERITPWAATHRTLATVPAGDEAPAAEERAVEVEQIGEPLGMLISRAGSDLGREYVVGGQTVSIGSGKRCAVRIDDPTLGAEEARLWVRKGHLMLHKLTRLTTLANEGLVGGWTILEPGDTFDVGEHKFEFRLLPEPETTPGDAASASTAPAPTPIQASAAPATGGTSAEVREPRLTDFMPRDSQATQRDEQAS
jgi:hypothetical protein